MLIAACPAMVAAERPMNRCPAYVPADATALRTPRLCRLVGAGDSKLAVCQEYATRGHRYQVISRGGTSPYSIRDVSSAEGDVTKIPMDDLQQMTDDRPCEPERPADVPESAKYRGTGVCEDEQGLPLPCSLYEHAGARDPVTRNYFIYYTPEGRGVRRIDVVPTGYNHSALEAELAYQIARSLFASGCCHSRAWAYAAHANALFPREALYQGAHDIPDRRAIPDTVSESGCRPASTMTMNPAR